MIRNPFLMATGLGDLINSIHYVRMCRRVNTLMRLRGAELEEFQNRRVRDIVRDAYENVELYNLKWQAAGIRPEDIQGVDDLKKLPLTTKEELRLSPPARLRSRAIPPQDCFTITTSGSTGSPMRFHVDEEKALLDTALSLPQHLAGMPPVSVGRATRDFLWRRDIAFMALVFKEEFLYQEMFWTMKHTAVDALAPADEHIRQINRKRPQVLYAYVSVLRNLCIRARETKVTLHRPRLIMVVGEVVDAHLREAVRRVFGTDLMDVYGSIEAGHMAAECPQHEGLHILTPKLVMELIDDQGREVPPGATGRVVVTDLFCRATPLIRYSGLGDYAVRSARPCSCGRSFPLLERVEGRIAHTVVLPNGRKLVPYQLTHALLETPYLSKFQIRQEQPDLLRVLLVKDRVPEADAVSFAQDGALGREIVERFQAILQGQMKIELVTVEEIAPPPGSRKFPVVISRVGS